MLVLGSRDVPVRFTADGGCLRGGLRGSLTLRVHDVRLLAAWYLLVVAFAKTTTLSGPKIWNISSSSSRTQPAKHSANLPSPALDPNYEADQTMYPQDSCTGIVLLRSLRYSRCHR